MSHEHIYSESVRSYLLGTLEERSAASIEERYFADRAFFLFVRAEETALINDYLAGRLARPIRDLFESRYLRVPELHRRLEEVRQGRSAARTSRDYQRQFRFCLAAAVLFICVGGAVFWQYRHRMRLESLPASSSQPILATVSLSPGLLKDPSAPAVKFSATPAKGNVQLILDLPGQPKSVPCSVRVLMATPEGSWKTIWAAPKPIWSTSAPGGQRLDVLLDAPLLGRGDYLVEVVGLERAFQETYFFRVTPL